MVDTVPEQFAHDHFQPRPVVSVGQLRDQGSSETQFFWRGRVWRDFYAMTEGAVAQRQVGPRGEQVRVVTLPLMLGEMRVDWPRLQEAFEQWLSR